jgi:L-threonylcarbamoyladenylate synthase
MLSKLRELDDMGAEKIYVRIPDKKGIGLAIFNRMLKASGYTVIKV